MPRTRRSLHPASQHDISETGSRSAQPGALERLRAAVEDVDRADQPRHLRLRAALLDAIAQGDWVAGDKLPSETEIARAVGLSLGTVQKTLSRLAAEEVLVRRHGHGSFVSGVSSQSDHLLHFRFLGDDGKALVPVYAEALDRSVVRDRGPWADFLGGAREFLRIRRRINVSNEFDCLSDFYIDADRFGAILEMPFAELHRIVIRDLLAKRFNAPTFSFSQRVYVTEFPASVRAPLKVPRSKGTGLVLEVRSYSHHRAPVSFQNIFVPAGSRPLEIPSPRIVR
jgi:GntR family transcriptional regulator